MNPRHDRTCTWEAGPHLDSCHSMSLYVTLHHSCLTLRHSCITLRHSTSLYVTLRHSTSLYVTPVCHSTSPVITCTALTGHRWTCQMIPVCHSTSLYVTLRHSTSLYVTPVSLHPPASSLITLMAVSSLVVRFRAWNKQNKPFNSVHFYI